VSIKRELIPDATMYFFADERFLGKAYELKGPTTFRVGCERTFRPAAFAPKLNP
jgi:hypothetical protein